MDKQVKSLKEHIMLLQSERNLLKVNLLEYRNTNLTPQQVVEMQEQLKEAMELLKLAYKDLTNKCPVCAEWIDKWSCTRHNATTDDCQNYEHWQWQHADRYEKLKEVQNERD